MVPMGQMILNILFAAVVALIAHNLAAHIRSRPAEWRRRRAMTPEEREKEDYDNLLDRML